MHLLGRQVLGASTVTIASIAVKLLKWEEVPEPSATPTALWMPSVSAAGEARSPSATL